MDYQQEYYKREHINSTIKEYIKRVLNRENKKLFNENGARDESADKKEERLNWYYENLNKIEYLSYPDLQREFINNGRFFNREDRTLLEDRLRGIKEGYFDLFVYEIKNISIRGRDGSRIAYYTNYLIEEIKEKLYELTEKNREIYVRDALRVLNNVYITDINKTNSEFKSLSQNKKEAYYRYAEFMHQFIDLVCLFNLDITSIVKNMKIESSVINIKSPRKKDPIEKSLPYSDDQALLSKFDTSKGFTTARQVLAITTLLSELKVDSNNSDKTDIARFIQMLTNKELGASRIQDTNIYKKYLSGTGKTDKNYTKDAEFVAGYFESLGLSNLAKKLTQ